MLISKDLKTKRKDGGKEIRANLGLERKEKKKKPNMFKCYCGEGFNIAGADFSSDVDMTGWDTSEAKEVSFKHATWEPGYSNYLTSFAAFLVLLF